MCCCHCAFAAVFLHRQRDGNTVTDQMIDTIRNAAANLVS